MHASDIVGYTYNAENYTPSAIVAQLTTNPGDVHHKSARIDNAEAHLDLLARLAGINRYDEASYDSSEFPKVIFADSVEPGETFLDSDGNYVDQYGDTPSVFCDACGGDANDDNHDSQNCWA